MMKFTFLSAIAAVTMLAPAPVLSAPVASFRSKVSFGSCPAGFPMAEGVRCGTLTVPEDRRRNGTRTISMPFLVLPATGTEPRRADPIVYLSGGPGYSAITSALSLMQRPEIRRGREMIVLEQRGNGYATPALVCNAKLIPGIVDVAKLAACRQRFLAAGIDLAAYDSTSAAADFDDLRRLLKIPQWNVLGISYGTPLGLVYAKNFPSGIRTLTLDSVATPNLNRNYYSNQPAALLDMLDDYLKGCERDALCSQRYPGLRAKLLRAVETLGDNPVNVTYGPTFDAKRLMSLLYDLLYTRSKHALIPEVITAASERRVSDLLKLVMDQSSPLPKGMDPALTVADGRQFSVFCGEVYPFSDPQTAALPTRRPWPKSAQVAARVISDGAFLACPVWRAQPARPSDVEVVTSSIPTLLLNGEFDPSTSPYWAETAARTLARSTFVKVPDGGHVSLDQACPREIMVSFLNAPDRRPDTGCIPAMAEGTLSALRAPTTR